MNCTEAKKKITIAVFGTLREEEMDDLNEHLALCEDCSARWEKTSALRNRPNNTSQVPLPDPERSWAVISERLSKHRRKSARKRIWRWAPAAAVLLVVFAMGLFFGRRLVFTPAGGRAPLSYDLSEAALETYADSLQPVLVNFINQDGVKNPASVERLERRIVSDLLAHTRLLKTLVPEEGNPSLRELLDELDFILTAMDNLEPGDRDTARHLAGLIEENRVPLRLRQLILDRTTL